MTTEQQRNNSKSKGGNGIDKKQEEIIHKYSDKGQAPLRESVIIAGIPYFMRTKYIEKRQETLITVEPYIVDATKKFRPPFVQECPYIPYEFKTVEEPNRYLQRALTETPDSLIQKIKAIVVKLNDVDDKTLNMLTLTIFNSYFQDRFSAVYYLIVVGANGTGKSVFGDTFECLGYRPVKVTNTTDAFWFRIFGTNEYGQVTIIAEEFDKIDESSQAMAVLKDGYQPNSKVPRMTSDYSKMEFFCPFGFKIIIAEKSPNENKARGLLDRSFKNKTYKGYPQYKIKEIRSPQGNRERQRFYDEIMDLRNLLIAYRLLHFKDAYKEIEIGLDGRDEELCKPTLELLYSLEASEETIRMAESTFQHFLDVKNNRKGETLDGVIYPLVVNTVSEYGNEIPSRQLWEVITNNLEGQLDEKNTRIFHSDDFGNIYMNNITSMVCDKFGAERKHGEKGSILVLDPNRLKRMEKIYHNKGIIKTDTLTHKTHPAASRSILSEHEENTDNDVVEHENPDTLDSPSAGSGKSVSVCQPERENHTPSDPRTSVTRCPHCDFEGIGYDVRIHRKCAHGEGI